jgi:hypothetical protein
VIHIRVSDEEHKKIQKFAKRKKQTVSETCRIILWLGTERK